jgi:hypothetical protein
MRKNVSAIDLRRFVDSDFRSDRNKSERFFFFFEDFSLDIYM